MKLLALWKRDIIYVSFSSQLRVSRNGVPCNVSLGHSVARVIQRVPALLSIEVSRKHEFPSPLKQHSRIMCGGRMSLTQDKINVLLSFTRFVATLVKVSHDVDHTHLCVCPLGFEGPPAEKKEIDVDLILLCIDRDHAILACIRNVDTYLLPGTAHFWSNREFLYNAYTHLFNSHWQNILKYYYIFFIVIFKNLFIMYYRFLVWLVRKQYPYFLKNYITL